MTSAPFGRVMSAMVTPFDDDGAFDPKAAASLAQWLVENGNDGLVLAGTTGESPTITDDEQIALFEAVRRGSRRPARRRDRRERHPSLDRPDRTSQRGRPRRDPRRHAVLQPPFPGRSARPFRGRVQRHRSARDGLRHPGTNRTQDLERVADRPGHERAQPRCPQGCSGEPGRDGEGHRGGARSGRLQRRRPAHASAAGRWRRRGRGCRHALVWPADVRDDRGLSHRRRRHARRHSTPA